MSTGLKVRTTIEMEARVGERGVAESDVCSSDKWKSPTESPLTTGPDKGDREFQD